MQYVTDSARTHADRQQPVIRSIIQSSPSCGNDVCRKSGVIDNRIDGFLVEESIEDPFTETVNNFVCWTRIILVPDLVEISILQFFEGTYCISRCQGGVTPAADGRAVKFHQMIDLAEKICEDCPVEMGDSEELGSSGSTNYRFEQFGLPAEFGELGPGFGSCNNG